MTSKRLYLVAVGTKCRVYGNKREALSAARAMAIQNREEWRVYAKAWEPGDRTNAYDYPTLLALSDLIASGSFAGHGAI